MNRTENKTKSTSDKNDKSGFPSLYIKIPNMNFNMSKLEYFCKERLTLLNKVMYFAEKALVEKMTTIDIITEFKEMNKFFQGDDERDEISHFCLRIAMCDSDDIQWFISAEVQLLTFKFLTISSSTYIQHPEFGFKTATENELTPEELKYIQMVEKCATLKDSLFKIGFEEIPILLENKKCVIKKGIAYAHIDHLKDLVLNIYRNYLNYALDKVKVDKARIKEEFPEVIEFFQTLPRHTAKRAQNAAVTKEEVFPLSKTSFPLCMRVMHDSLLRTSQLKHEGRLEFSTFLKGIGLPYEEAIQYWKTAFSKRVTANEFDKEYTYTFRHTYGLEGKGISYSPYSCAKIIPKIPSGFDQVHGCPYMWPADRLEQKLLELGINDIQTAEILQSATITPNIACTKHFEYLHPKAGPQKVISHPNQFFESSREYYKQLEQQKDDQDPFKKDNDTTNSNN
ncbi:hypothetical protein DLAC_08359 [Tieghemostelium lacteum]|uniref:DNA primase large subunit C-terminal domain-containing protein n=1 Tax=Tieghemostelium lacteum TaxID=361077 RepID=A0A151ZBT3_TIELA|nr:hypothetical protein DLAC_08359 [Tieghemostelium lacteum]|eukprot:KYQ91399.1 hypothetical protein DLAC_08359 [Tieghemostelium lacteum]